MFVCFCVCVFVCLCVWLETNLNMLSLSAFVIWTIQGEERERVGRRLGGRHGTGDVVEVVVILSDHVQLISESCSNHVQCWRIVFAQLAPPRSWSKGKFNIL